MADRDQLPRFYDSTGEEIKIPGWDRDFSLTGMITVGALIRRHVRVQLDLLGVNYREHKGFLDSQFVVTASERQWQRIRQIAPD